MIKGKFKAIGLIFVLLVAIISFWEMSYRQKKALELKQGVLFFPNDKKLVSRGEEIYQDNCASCHGANLEGEANWRSPNEDGLMPAPPHDESGHTWHHKDKLLFDIVKYGLARAANLENYQTNMPIYEGVLSDEEIIAVMSYIKSTWPKEIIARQNMLNSESPASQ